ncbi:E3 ubiquitin-protein ligase MARCHF2 isoform X1 [Dermochelys coriacea]|uniref:E3 ubiquitin-protein ligase MARCHF2 isoform X1 n=1 Tax=Dermochelys coriacea TaxID=27794 RepID=UPI001CA8DFAC|nr:E3 ubiquitin-protein ligase MARCHF2 isoform X1 [Dermochelys coriacea]
MGVGGAIPLCCSVRRGSRREAVGGVRRPLEPGYGAAQAPLRLSPEHRGRQVVPDGCRVIGPGCSWDGEGGPIGGGDGPICRICHEGGNGEGLLSPCDCTGTLGTVHKSCLEKWLSSSNTSYCELCHTEFVVERRPRPLTEWLKDPGPRNEKRTLFCDMVCFLFITPLAAISGWLCLRGAQDHLQFNSRLEAIGLIALTIALFTIYVLWTLVSFRYHCQLYSEWRRTNQKVRLMIPDSKSPHPVQHSLLSTKLMKKNADETTV